MSTKHKRPALSPTTEVGELMVYPFSEEEYNRCIAALKNKKAAGIDDVLVEQLNNLGHKTHKWLLGMLNNCFIQNRIPTIWREIKDHHHIETRGLCDTQKLPANIPPVPHVQTIRTFDPEQNNAYH